MISSVHNVEAADLFNWKLETGPDVEPKLE